MLKIKDNVDLKELEKFGLKKIEGTYEYDNKNETGYIFIGNYMRQVCCSADNRAGDILYDLITAGLIEKC